MNLSYIYLAAIVKIGCADSSLSLTVDDESFVGDIDVIIVV